MSENVVAKGNFGKKNREIFAGSVFRLCLMLFAVFSPVFFYAFRLGHVFIDNVIFNGFCLTLLMVMIINALFAFFTAVIKVRGVTFKGKDIFETTTLFVLTWISLILTIFFVVLNIGVMITMKMETLPTAFRMVADILPTTLLIFGGGVLIFFFPTLKDNVFKKVIVWLLVALMIFSVLAFLFPTYVYKINSHPMVIDTGSDYSVVFTTNDTGTGYVEYKYDGKDYKIYDENDGRLVGDKIVHSINVPYEHLENNQYRVGSTRILDELSYGGRHGSTKTSDYYTLTVKKSGDIDVLMLSDWHTEVKKARKTAQQIGNVDAVIMLGDAVPGLMYEEEIAINIVEFAGDITKGSKPIIFTRGNHETRGPWAGKLKESLGMKSFYYTAKIGDCNVIVLDSGEDKKDSHPEYGGMVNYENERKNMLNWLDKIEFDKTEKVIVLSHDYKVCIEEDLSKRAYDKFKQLGVDGIYSGHTHNFSKFEYEGIPIVMDGGKSGKSYSACKLTIKQNGLFEVEGFNNKGEKIAPKNN